MTLAEEIAREHVRWCVQNGRTLAQVILELGYPLPGKRRQIRFEDAVAAVAMAWEALWCDELLEAA